jgi:hypothetical protein
MHTLFSILPLHSFSTTHTILYSLTLLIRKQAIYIKASAITWNSVDDGIKIKLHLHVTRSTDTAHVISMTKLFYEYKYCEQRETEI